MQEFQWHSLAGRTDFVRKEPLCYPKEWLQEQTTIEDAERENQVKDKALGPDPLPFGFQHNQWLHFKRQIMQGDQIWSFSSSAESWKHLGGRAGLCIVRDGEVVDSFVTMMN
jgi:hypothetical protein